GATEHCKQPKSWHNCYVSRTLNNLPPCRTTALPVFHSTVEKPVKMCPASGPNLRSVTGLRHSAPKFSNSQFGIRSLRPRRGSDPDLFQGQTALAECALGAGGIVAGLQFGQIVQRERAETERLRRRLVDNHRQPNHGGSPRFQKRP